MLVCYDLGVLGSVSNLRTNGEENTSTENKKKRYLYNRPGEIGIAVFL